MSRSEIFKSFLTIKNEFEKLKESGIELLSASHVNGRYDFFFGCGSIETLSTEFETELFTETVYWIGDDEEHYRHYFNIGDFEFSGSANEK